ncbi:MAG TPA: M1 family metallopeptidase [Clostridia bacterium]|nr:M1 family metallopeptidase [Clostridia bacterium]
MRKRSWAFLILFLFSWACFGNPPTRAAALPGGALLEATEGLAQYEVEAAFSPAQSQLNCRQTLIWSNPTGQTQEAVYLRVYANAFQTVETSPVGKGRMKTLCYGPAGFDAGGLTLDVVKVNGMAASWSYEDAAQTVLRIETPGWAAGETRVVRLMYRVRIPNCAYRFGHAGDVWTLGNVFPQMALWDGEAWRLDPYGPIGDPFFHDCANWRVTLRTPPGYRAAGSGSRVRESGYRTVFEAPAVREFALVIGKYGSMIEQRAGDTLVRVYAPTAEKAEACAEIAAQALELFERWYGPYPWPSLDIASVEFPYGGMEYPGLLMIREEAFDQTETLARVTAHEIAHQWFYGLVGNDPVREPWLDEALATFSELLYVQYTEGDEALRQIMETEIAPSRTASANPGLASGSGIEDFGDLYTYGQLVYRRGCAMMWDLYETMGEQTLSKALQGYIAAHAFGLATREDFAQALEAATGKDWHDFLAEYLDP